VGNRDYWRDKEKQLRDKENKLRDKEKQLRDKENKLRDEKKQLLDPQPPSGMIGCIAPEFTGGNICCSSTAMASQNWP